MKNEVVAILLVCSALVSAYGGDTEAVDVIGCYSGLESCGRFLRHYQSPDFQQIVESVHKAGIRTLCSDIGKATSCIIDVLEETNCPANIDQVFSNARGAINLICVDHINEVAEHWDCYFGARIDPNQPECQRYPESMAACDTEDLIECIGKAAKKTPICKPGAIPLISEIMDKFIAILPHCAGGRELHRLLFNFLKK